MKKKVIDLFFLELDRQMRSPAEVIITGAAAGSLFGNVRASLDIDFEIRLKDAKKKEIDALVRRIGRSVGVGVNFSEDIGHWSMIDYLDYRRKAIPYRKIGKINLHLMAPEYWTIGKMTRYMAIDIGDIVKVAKKRRLRSDALAHLWGRALKASPLSLVKGRFRENVKDFLKRFGKRVWGRSFDADKATQKFLKTAGIRSVDRADFPR